MEWFELNDRTLFGWFGLVLKLKLPCDMLERMVLGLGV